MSINKEFYAPREEIKRGDVVLCTIRGLTPDDIAQAMVENSADMKLLIETLEGDKSLASIDLKDQERVMEALTDNSGKLFTTLISSVPNLAAKLIAISADDPSAADYVKREYVMPLQFDILTKIARMTFVNEGGFKEFLGNAMALFGSRNEQRLDQTPSVPASSTG